jgi:hypothetical protein
MKRLIAVVFVLAAGGGLFAQAGGKPNGTGLEEGILERVENASVAAAGDGFTMTRRDHQGPVEMTFARCEGLGVDRAEGQWWVLPMSATASEGSRIDANEGLWILPMDAKAKDHSWHLELHGGKATATKTAEGLKVAVDADAFAIHRAEARPHSDPFGYRFSVKGWRMRWLGFTGERCCHWWWRRRWRRTSSITMGMC